MNPEAGWTFVLEPGDWMDFHLETQRLDGLSSRTRRLDGLSSRNPEAGWTFVHEPEGWMDFCPGTQRLDGLLSRNPEAVALNLEVSLDPKVALNPEVAFGTGGLFERGGCFWTRRLLLDLEVFLNQEVAFLETIFYPLGYYVFVLMPIRRVGLLIRVNSSSGPVGLLIRRVGLLVPSNSPLGRVGRASSSPRWGPRLIEPYSRFVVSTPRIHLSEDSSNLSQGFIV
ncbi:hypothetical protein YC2023_117237 [Brassica napus]